MQLLREDRPASAIFSSLTQELSVARISFRFQAVGQSMYPAIRSGEMLHVEPLDNCKLRCGDIVLFHRSDGLKAHRIVKISGEAFVTRGDSSLHADGEVSREQIVGRVIAKECGTSGKLVSLVGMLPRGRFLVRKLRGRIGRSIRRRGDAERAIAEQQLVNL